MLPPALTDHAFDRLVSLRDAYCLMERFASAYLARGGLALGRNKSGSVKAVTEPLQIQRWAWSRAGARGA